MKTLKELFTSVEILQSNINMDAVVEGIEVNSQKISNNFIFFALKDTSYAKDAIDNGALCIVSETKINDLPCICVNNIRKVLCLVCANFYDNPHVNMHFIGVVGTNGKTSTTHIINHILSESGKKTCLIGTLGVKINQKLNIPFDMTTPDPNEFYKILKEAKNNSVEYVIMEISAHAIYFEKLYGIIMDYCIFTNISQDHLDFFKDMKTYSKVKESYFNNDNVRLGIINVDDIIGRKIMDSKEICCLSYGLYYPSDVFALNIEYDNGTRFVANVFDDVIFVKSPLLGEFNVSNTLAAISVAKVIGIESKQICISLETLPQIEGRFDVITNQKTAIIDYAHTPDGLKSALLASRKLCKGKLIVVFGCGGNRDANKRPIMGQIAATYCDIAVITSDNPRFENPEEIIESIVSGFADISHSYIKICDRQKAIEFALSIADKTDIVLIAGKGGEDYLDIKGEKLPYSDKAVCQNILRRYIVD